ncbi:Urocanate hydratase [Halotydeus destructor]|nr:Urocanate hydratase [Halotydeus destructor]
MSTKEELQALCQAGLPADSLPQLRPLDPSVPHAPAKPLTLTRQEVKLAIKNALRYVPRVHHQQLIPEFAQELTTYGHIYMYRFRPPGNFVMRAYPADWYPAKTQEGAVMVAMIMNNLDPRVAQFPEELVTYGGNGQAFSNWLQFRLTIKYLCDMTTDQTLVLYSGHPLGLFPSAPSCPRMTISNGMMVPNYSTKEQYDRLFALGVTMYGQMTAGSFCYIGPQGIVHGTVLTLLNAGRKFLGSGDLAGKVFLTSGLGGMSGAQAKAAVICGCVGVVAEVSHEALVKRHAQKWLDVIEDNLDRLVDRVRQARQSKTPISIGYHGNVVDVWTRMAEVYQETGELLVDLGSDQTSLHNPFLGGYYPYQVTYEHAQTLMKEKPGQFKEMVQGSLRKQVEAINILAKGGMFFWDYGNAFLLEAGRAGGHVGSEDSSIGGEFRYPSYVQYIMGDIFSLGFGPFRWVCMSQDPVDLAKTDKMAAQVIEDTLKQSNLPANVRAQYEDNLKWICAAADHQLVVGSQARILYSDQVGRTSLALAFNMAVRDGTLKGPVVISRDHHDVSGTDSPYRETANVYDGSNLTADMAVSNFVGDAARGATWVALHNGGGIGWGEVVNGGFGLVLDGSAEADKKARSVLGWDVSHGVARRAWAGNANARQTILTTMDADQGLSVTVASEVDDVLLGQPCSRMTKNKGFRIL